MKGFFVVFITVVVMGWLASRGAATKAHQAGNDWVFPIVRSIQWLYVSVVALGLAGVFFGLLGPPADRSVTLICGLVFVFFAVLSWPKAIYVSPTVIRQRTWFGGWRSVSWSLVSDVVERRDRCLVVRSSDEKIVYSPYHADPERFRAEIVPHHKLTTLKRP